MGEETSGGHWRSSHAERRGTQPAARRVVRRNSGIPRGRENGEDVAAALPHSARRVPRPRSRLGDGRQRPDGKRKRAQGKLAVRTKPVAPARLVLIRSAQSCPVAGGLK